MNIPSNNKNITSVILYGGTGQAKVVRPIIEHQGVNIVAIFDDTNGTKPPFEDIPIYYGFESLIKWSKRNNIDNVGFVVCIGNPHGAARCEIAQKLSELGYIPYSVVDPSAIISNSSCIGEGVQIMAGAVIMPEVVIGNQCIINTRASIDHESIIDNGCEVSPGATLCGCVTMNFNSWVGAGATISPRCIIGKNSIVGAGAVVIDHVEDNSVVVGIPAKKIRNV